MRSRVLEFMRSRGLEVKRSRDLEVKRSTDIEFMRSRGRDLEVKEIYGPRTSLCDAHEI